MSTALSDILTDIENGHLLDANLARDSPKKLEDLLKLLFDIICQVAPQYDSKLFDLLHQSIRLYVQNWTYTCTSIQPEISYKSFLSSDSVNFLHRSQLNSIHERIKSHRTFTQSPNSTSCIPQSQNCILKAIFDTVNTLNKNGNTNSAIVEHLIAPLREIITLSVNTSEIIQLFQAIRTSRSPARSTLLDMVSTLFQSTCEPRGIFIMRGPHTGILVFIQMDPPSSVKKGYSFSVTLKSDPEDAEIVPIITLFGINGQGLTIYIDRNEFVVRCIGNPESLFQQQQLRFPFEAARKRSKNCWTQLCVVHARNILFKDKWTLYVDGKLYFSGNLPYFDPMCSPKNLFCIGIALLSTTIHRFQGQICNPTLFDQALIDTEVEKLHNFNAESDTLHPEFLSARQLFCFDARFTNLKHHIAFDTSGTQCVGILEPDTHPIVTNTVNQAMEGIGGCSTLLLLLLDQNPNFIFSADEIGKLLQAISIGLDSNPASRWNFIRADGVAVLAVVLESISPASLTRLILQNVSSILSHLSAASTEAQMARYVYQIFFAKTSWFESPLETQKMLFGEKLPKYIEIIQIWRTQRLLSTNSDSKEADATLTVNTSFLCALLEEVYCSESIDANKERSVLRRLLIDHVIDRLLFPKHGASDSDEWKQLLAYICSVSQTRPSKSIVVEELLHYIANCLHSFGPNSGSRQTLYANILRISKGTLRLWWEPLHSPMASVRYSGLCVLEAYALDKVMFHRRDTLMLHSALSMRPLDMASVEIVINIVLGRRKSLQNQTRTTRTVKSTRLDMIPHVLVAMCSKVDVNLQALILLEIVAVMESDGVKEAIRSWPQWLSRLLALMHLEEATSPVERTEESMRLCSLLGDTSTSMATKLDTIERIHSSSNQLDAEVVIESQFDAKYPFEFGRAYLQLAMDLCPGRCRDIVRKLAFQLIIDIAADALINAEHGWLIALELYFHHHQDISAITNIMAAYSEKLTPQLRFLRADNSIVWGNMTQFAALITHIHLHFSKKTSGSELLRHAASMWSLVLPHIASLDWNQLNASMAMSTEVPQESVPRRLIANLSQSRSLALQIWTQYIAFEPSLCDAKAFQVPLEHLRVLEPDCRTYDWLPTRSIDLHIFLVDVCFSILTHEVALHVSTRQCIFQVIVQLARTALQSKHFDDLTEVTLIKAFQIIASTDLSFFTNSKEMEELQALWRWQLDQIKGEVDAAKNSVTRGLSKQNAAFQTSWAAFIASNAGGEFNPYVVQEDVTLRASILSDEMAACEALWVDLATWKDTFTERMIRKRNAYQTSHLLSSKRAAERFGCSIQKLSTPCRQPSESLRFLYKLGRRETQFRIRLVKKVAEDYRVSAPSRECDMESLGDSTGHLPRYRVSLDRRSSHENEGGWRSETGSEYDLFSDAHMRAAILKSSVGKEQQEQAFEEISSEDEDEMAEHNSVVKPAMTDGQGMAQEAPDRDQAPGSSSFGASVMNLVGGVAERVQQAARDAKEVVDFQVDALYTARDVISDEAHSVFQGVSTIIDNATSPKAAPTRDADKDFKHEPASASTTFKQEYRVDANLIHHMHIVQGQLVLTASRLHFHPMYVIDEHGNVIAEQGASEWRFLLKQRRWEVDDIVTLYRRRYLLRANAIEISISSSRKNYFFTLAMNRIVPFFEALMARRPLLLRKSPMMRRLRLPSSLFRNSNMTFRWTQHEISTFEYLMWLNTVAGRTYNDLTQYPIFPWILSDYDSKTLDLSRSSSFRDLAKPIGALDPDRLAFFLDRCAGFEDPDIPKFLYGSHYSNIGAVLYYLIRLEPFTSFAQSFQGGKFDHADRMFHSIPETWRNCLTDPVDVKELTPEWFYLPEFLVNCNDCDFGVRQNGVHVGDVLLPAWAVSPEDFIAKNYAALESEFVSQHLHQWIDLIFGYKQRGHAAKAANNVFFYLTYEGMVDVDSIADAVVRASMRAQIAHFGQTPSQLLREPHPLRLGIPEEMVPKAQASNTCRMTVLRVPHNVAIRYIRVTQSAVLCMDDHAYVSCHRVVGKHTQKSQHTSAFFQEGPSKVSSPSSRLPDREHTLLSLEFMELHDRKSHKIIAWPHDIPSPKNLAFLDGNTVFCTGGHYDFSAQFHSTADGSLLTRLLQHQSVVQCVATNVSGTLLLLGCQNGTMSVWKTTETSSTRLEAVKMFRTGKGRPVHAKDYAADQVLLGHNAPITSITVLEEAAMCISGSENNVCLAHHVWNGSILQEYNVPGHQSPGIVSLAISELGHFVVQSLGTGLPMLYTFHWNGSMMASLDLHNTIMDSVDICARYAKVIISNSKEAAVLTLYTLKDRVPVPLSDYHGNISAQAISRDQTHLILGTTQAKLIAIPLFFACHYKAS
uniref:Nucleotide binding protein putative n=1 Tax=Albugo laibachii Nc14 TaxID=890382 RepID=F0W2J0_9STRA|nr:nucleotide binding protein putative [Albugo laibachii Nc14]|eukprot:CCA15276.1 nucleotide binding protein putative [Albugo laibachii Nc14]